MTDAPEGKNWAGGWHTGGGIGEKIVFVLCADCDGTERSDNNAALLLLLLLTPRNFLGPTGKFRPLVCLFCVCEEEEREFCVFFFLFSSSFPRPFVTAAAAAKTNEDDNNTFNFSLLLPPPGPNPALSSISPPHTTVPAHRP